MLWVKGLTISGMQMIFTKTTCMLLRPPLPSRWAREIGHYKGHSLSQQFRRSGRHILQTIESTTPSPLSLNSKKILGLFHLTVIWLELSIEKWKWETRSLKYSHHTIIGKRLATWTARPKASPTRFTLDTNTLARVSLLLKSIRDTTIKLTKSRITQRKCINWGHLRHSLSKPQKPGE